MGSYRYILYNLLINDGVPQEELDKISPKDIDKVLFLYNSPEFNISNKTVIKRGSVLRIELKALDNIKFDHYAIYAGNKEIIHFSEGEIKKTSIYDFIDTDRIEKQLCKPEVLSEKLQRFRRLKGEDCLEINPLVVTNHTLGGIGGIFDIFSIKTDEKNSGEVFVEVIEFDEKKFENITLEDSYFRAKKLVDRPDIKYNLLGSNCEHFAVWCRTNVPYSSQSGSNSKEKYYQKYKDLRAPQAIKSIIGRPYGECDPNSIIWKALTDKVLGVNYPRFLSKLLDKLGARTVNEIHVNKVRIVDKDG